MIYSCMGMVWVELRGVMDTFHTILGLVGDWLVYKKARGVIVEYGKNAYLYYFSDSEGSRTRAQRLGEMKVERKE